MTQDSNTPAAAPGQSAGASSKHSDTAAMSLTQQGAAAADENRGEVSASTVARMMGLATVAEVRLMEGKVDLLGTKLNLLQVKIEKVLTLIGNVATGADLERIDVQIGALRQIMRDIVSKEAEKHAGAGVSATVSSDGAKKPGANIQSNS